MQTYHSHCTDSVCHSSYCVFWHILSNYKGFHNGYITSTANDRITSTCHDPVARRRQKSLEPVSKLEHGLNLL